MNELTGNKASFNYRETVIVKNRITKNLLELGRLLKESDDNKYYKAYADSFTEYLGTSEISLSRSFAFKLMFNFSKWVEELGVDQDKLSKIDSEKLYLTGIQATKEDYEEWLEKAETLSRSDIRSMVEEEKQVKADDYRQVICPSCGHSFGVRV